MKRRLWDISIVTIILSAFLGVITKASDGETCPEPNEIKNEKEVEWTVPNPYKFFEESQLKSNKNGNFGHFLDAGTGTTSIRWLSSMIHRGGDEDDVSVESYTAITADHEMHQKVINMTTQQGIHEKGEVIIGNWIDGVRKDGTLNTRKNNYLLHGKEGNFDTILVDYLIGAMDRFSPYFQDIIFERLATHLKPGGRIYILGLEPIPDKGTRTSAAIWSEIKHARDASMMLAGKRPYREYPLEWIERMLAKSDGLNVVTRKIYPLSLPFHKLLQEINNGRLYIKYFSSKKLKDSMTNVFDELEAESLRITKEAKGGKIRSGFEYALVVEKENLDTK